MDPPCFGRNPSHADISAVEFLVHPSVLENMFPSEEASENDGQHDEEDTRAGVCARAFGFPGGGIEGSRGGGEEDILHR